MKEADKIINYRPELAKHLNKYLDFSLKLYAKKFQKYYYQLLSEGSKEAGDEIGSEYFGKMAECFNDANFYQEEKCQQVMKEYGIHGNPVSEARAAYFVFEWYKPVFEEFKTGIFKEFKGLTKMERFMVDDFFNKLTAPMRNPNIEIHEVHTQCWYDREYKSFSKDLTLSVGYVKENCQCIIDVFSIPDEKELNPDCIEMENIRE